MRALGLSTIGDLLEHLPRDSREARTVADLRADEQATVAVQVRTIRSRPVRRRGMRPLVEATVQDETGSMRATFFNQPWLVERYPPGTSVLLHGKADARGGFRVSHHALAPGQASLGSEAGSADGAPAREDVPRPASGAVAHYPASEGVSSTQILTLVQQAREHLIDVCEALPGRTRARRAAARSRERAGGDALPARRRGQRRRTRAPGLRRAAADAARVPAAPRAPA